MNRQSTTVGNVRKCSNCFQYKELGAFYAKREGHQSRCKDCNAEVVAGYKDRAKHGEVIRYNTKYRKTLGGTK